MYREHSWGDLPEYHQDVLDVLGFIRTDDSWLEYLDHKEETEIDNQIRGEGGFGGVFVNRGVYRNLGIKENNSRVTRCS